ncbi:MULTISPECIES: glycerophosphodiester phosphodiesterase family protein [unclassified Chitinophaga]|uniref:glycerophosphodiester phosphodiesterase family protein n=1 Tax=unclassified Chitinophaga TaxID=2619133 RepID=UPI0009D4DB3A|nr:MULTISPECIES: glycerophosphodiester phosphodiesterase family protein [unclassified Chitinophaga]OMP75260.1 glycerophosphodiester phosphodiesterase [[Flexibacter] sp. ATCC 35208]WPV66562.1 glycerophosphodiester phosphodiesterase family protein [Chitinophaga sp. LS1]
MKQLLTFLLLLSALSGKSQVNAIISEFKNPAGKEVLVAAHRGDWRDAPENSVAAIKLAIAIGVDIVELDVQKTADGQLIIMHDEKIDRTTTGKGKVGDFTLDSLKKLYLRNGCGVPTQHRIPTLEEAMLAVKGKVMVNLDKSYRYINECYVVLEKTGTVEQAIFKGDALAAKVKDDYAAVLKKIYYMSIVSLDDAEAFNTIHDAITQIKPTAFELLFKRDTSAVLSHLKEIKQSRLWVNALWPSLNGGHYDDMAFDDGNIKDSWQWLLDKGFNIIQTDRPALLLAYLRKKGLHK